MTSQEEDTLYNIHTALTESKLWPEFNKQIKKMSSQNKHKWKTVCERWEYAFNKVKNNNGSHS